MRLLLKISCCLALLALIQSCAVKGDGPVIQQGLDIGGVFSGVAAQSSFDVIVTLGDGQTVTAEGQQNIIDKIRAEVNNDGVLELGLEEGRYKDFTLTIYVTVPTANKFYVTGSGDMTVFYSEALQLASLDLQSSGSGDLTGIGEFAVDAACITDLSGSGDINFDLNAGQVEVTSRGAGHVFFDVIASEIDASITGSGDLNFSGFSPTQNVVVSGSGDYNAFWVDSQNTTAELSGSGNMDCKVSNQLNVTISGSGSLRYRGTPVVSETNTGTGTVVNAN